MTVTGIAFVIAFFGGLGLALLRHPMYGLATYIAEFYLHPPSRWWGEFLPDLRWSLLAAGITLLAIWFRAPPQPGRPSWISTTPARVMIVFTLWFWVSGFWALDPDEHYPEAILLTKYILVFYMIYRLVDTPGKTSAFLLVHITGCLYLGWLAYQAGAPGGRLDGVGGPGINDSNTLGMHLATGIVVAATMMFQSKGWRYVLCVVSIAFSLNALVLTGTRGGMLALVGAGFMLMYLKPSIYRRQFYLYGLLGLVLLGSVATERFWDRMETTAVAATGNEQEMDFSAYSRIAMFMAQIEMAKEYPFGAGYLGSAVLSPRYLDAKELGAQGVRSSHNAFMTVLVEQGIPGTIMLIILVGWTAGTLRKLARTTRSPDQVTRALHASAVGGALTAVLVGGLFADFSKAEVQIWMLALLAALAVPQTTATKQTVAPAVANGSDDQSIAYRRQSG